MKRKDFRKARKSVDVSVGESVRILLHQVIDVRYLQATQPGGSNRID